MQRGQADARDARARFLRPALDELSDPFALAGMAEAVDAIAAAVRAGGTILVHGDYDVDGQCATALLTRALRAAGADVVPFVPHRLRDGYDFGPAGLAAAQRGRRLAHHHLRLRHHRGGDGATRRGRAGIGVVVTDHHLPGDELPPAIAVVDPQRAGRHLRALGCSAAPASPSSWCRRWCRRSASRRTCRSTCSTSWRSPPWPTWCRSRARTASWCGTGSGSWRESSWPGLRALLEAARPRRTRRSAPARSGFILGPRLNAAGRIGDAADGLRLLLTDDPAEAAALARRLEGLNTERQALDQRILDEALAQVEQTADLERDAGFVLAADGWHPGVVGIVASRVVERYGRPTFLIAFDGEIGKGSGRSISRFDLHAALLACGDLLERFGGHHMAAGLTIRRGPARRVPRALRRHRARARSAPEDLGPEQRVDLELGLARGHRRAGAALPPPRALRHREPEPGLRRARRAVRRPLSGWGRDTSRALLDDGRTAAAARSASSGPTGCPGSATTRSTPRSASSATSGTGSCPSRRGSALGAARRRSSGATAACHPSERRA